MTCSIVFPESFYCTLLPLRILLVACLRFEHHSYFHCACVDVCSGMCAHKYVCVFIVPRALIATARLTNFPFLFDTWYQ